MKTFWRIALTGWITLAVFGAPAFAAADSGGRGPCERALLSCLADPGHNLPWDIIACLQGYDFCKRFVEPLLNREG